MTWVLLVSTQGEQLTTVAQHAEAAAVPQAIGQRQMVDTASGEHLTVPVYARQALKPGMQLAGPAVIVEQDTTTVVSVRFNAHIHPLGYIILEQKHPGT